MILHRNKLIRLIVGLFICLQPLQAFSDSLTMTTWYPAPYGVYTNLRSTRDAYFAYQSGNVGIGTKTPAGKLDVEGTGNIIFNSGNVGIGTTNPANKLDVGSFGAGANMGLHSASYGSDGILLLYNAGGLNTFQLGPASDTDTFFWTRAGDLQFNPGNAERMRITSTGNVGIGTASPQSMMHIRHPGGPGLILQPQALDQGGNPQSWVEFRDPSGNRIGSMGFPGPNLSIQTSAGDIILYQSAGNRVITRHYYTSSSQSLCAEGGYASNSAYAIGECSSSREYKEDVKPLVVNKNKLLQLQPVSFKWKKNHKPDVGLIAEDVARTLPEIANFHEGKATGVEYKLLSIYLLDIIKGHDAEISSIKKENAELKNRLTQLERRMNP